MPSAIDIYKYKKKTKPVKEDKEVRDTTPPNREYLQLTICEMDATFKTSSSKNETITMKALPGNMYFTVTRGDTGVRWNNKKKTQKLLMSDWDITYANFILQGYNLYDTKEREKLVVSQKQSSVNGEVYVPIKDDYAASIVERLLEYANQMVEEDYQTTVTDMPDEAFDKARSLLDDLAREYESIENKEFNKRLTRLFAILPRRIDKLAKYLAADDADALARAEIIETERERLDVLYSVLRGSGAVPTGKETILEAYGIEIRAFNDAEISFVKQKLAGQASGFVRGWRVINHRTEGKFNEFCNFEKLAEKKGIDFLFHGSRSENWWSIITKGLTINPVGVVITAKMFGNGTYFAPDAIKSLGYTSRIGAKWTSGGQSTGFMAIYKVATGNQYNPPNSDSSLNWDNLQKRKEGAHCTWCKRGGNIGLSMDEVIVYKDEQSTVWGLLELSM
mgnify:CR=1 FL=1